MTSMKKIALSPGTMGLCALAIDLVGVDNVDPGHWLSPVYILTERLSQEDLQAAIELIQERGREVNMPISVTRL